MCRAQVQSSSSSPVVPWSCRLVFRGLPSFPDVRSEVDHFAALHHDQHGIPVAHFDLVAHGAETAEQYK
jgi:hypothetical protein